MQITHYTFTNYSFNYLIILNKQLFQEGNSIKK
jgi:hypothetical protein